MERSSWLLAPGPGRQEARTVQPPAAPAHTRGPLGPLLQAAGRLPSNPRTPDTQNQRRAAHNPVQAALPTPSGASWGQPRAGPPSPPNCQPAGPARPLQDARSACPPLTRCSAPAPLLRPRDPSAPFPRPRQQGPRSPRAENSALRAVSVETWPADGKAGAGDPRARSRRPRAPVHAPHRPRTEPQGTAGSFCGARLLPYPPPPRTRLTAPPCPARPPPLAPHLPGCRGAGPAPPPRTRPGTIRCGRGRCLPRIPLRRCSGLETGQHGCVSGRGRPGPVGGEGVLVTSGRRRPLREALRPP